MVARSPQTNRVALVTGAGVGIGYAICRALAEAGAWVALNDIDGELANRAAAEINREIESERVHAYVQDVADVSGVRNMVDEVIDQYGRLDIVVANAGITTFGAFLDFTAEAFDRITSVNLRGSYFTAQAAARKMIELDTRDGRIILMSSVTGTRALLNLGAYGITKAGIRHMAKVLALELAGYGITVNAIAPGATLTKRNLTDDPEYEANWAEVTPNGRVGYVNDIVATALFLADRASGHITGQTILVDGGWTLQSPLPSTNT